MFYFLGPDINEEIEKLKVKFHNLYRIQGKKIIYDPDTFEVVCKEAGCLKLFKSLTDAQLSSRQSLERYDLARLRSLTIIYKLCYGKSQWANYMQRDFAIYLRNRGVSQEAIETARVLGDCCSYKTVAQDTKKIEADQIAQLEQFVNDATLKEHLIVAVIDDYTAIHTFQRPQSEETSKAKKFATIILKSFPNIPAISNDVSPHYISGLNVNKTVEFITSETNTTMFTQVTYASSLPDWARKDFFQPDNARQRIATAEYSNSVDAQKMRKMDNVHLVDFVEMPLKNASDYNKAMEILAASPLQKYMDKHLIPLLGDHPTQFYTRQNIYTNLPGIATNQQSPTDTTLEQSEHHSIPDLEKQPHTQAFTSQMPILPQSSSEPQQALPSEPSPPTQPSAPPQLSQSSSFQQQCQKTSIISRILNFIPFLGALHIALNAKEEIVSIYYPFFQSLYKHLFPNKVFPINPKAW